jgi:ATP-dependent exoDNAse (exonuclease V) beta subunit
MLGVPGDAKIAEEQVINAIKRDCMRSTVDDFFENGTDFAENEASFTELADTIGQVRDTSSVDAELLWLAGRLHACGKDSSELTKYAERLYNIARGESDFMQSDLGAQVRESVKSYAEHFRNRAAYFAEEMPWEEKVYEKYGPTLEYIREWIDALWKKLESGMLSYADLKLHFDGYLPPKLGTVTAKNKTDLSLAFKAFRDEMKKESEKMQENFFASQEADLLGFAEKTARMLLSARRVIGEYEEKLTRRKRTQSLLDYNDLEEFALKLFLWSISVAVSVFR